jgi:seryl-tRNA synthetase
MLDIKLIRSDPNAVRENLKRRGDREKLKLLEELIKKDGEWRASLKRAEELRKRRNDVTREIADLKKRKRDASKLLGEVRNIPERIKRIEEQNDRLRERIAWILMRLPNMLHESVPVGKDNRVVREWGKRPVFKFRPKNHAEILEKLGMINIEKAAEVSGAGFYYLKGDIALLDYAILRYTIDFMVSKGYTLVEPPYMMRRKPYEGVTDLSDFESVMYKVENDDLYLIATSEHPMAAMHMNEIAEIKDLPVKLVGVSPCFRREIGSHGKYTKGLFRVHHFNKVEQFIFCHPRDSWKYHEELQKNSDALYQKLGLAYRVVDVCTGDIGSLAAKKYDTEIWMADGEYREIGSNSNCTDYQARRLNIRFREKEGQAPTGFVHTLNNTALATSRTMVAIIEQYQQEDGSVEIPKVLRPYMNGLKRIEK